MVGVGVGVGVGEGIDVLVDVGMDVIVEEGGSEVKIVFSETEILPVMGMKTERPQVVNIKHVMHNANRWIQRSMRILR